jgi:hypothetical protein
VYITTITMNIGGTIKNEYNNETLIPVDVNRQISFEVAFSMSQQWLQRVKVDPIVTMHIFTERSIYSRNYRWHGKC